MSNIYNFAYEELSEGINLFLQKFKIYFSSDSLSLKAKTFECVNELLYSTTTNEQVKLFKDFIFKILETTKLCLEKNDKDNLKICLDSI